MSSAFNVQYFVKVFPKILQFLPTTAAVAVVSLLAALVFGMILALIRRFRVKMLLSLIHI